MLLYKVTDRNNLTLDNILYDENVTRKVDITAPVEMYSPRLIYVYLNIHLATIFNSILGHVKEYKIWLSEGHVLVKNHIIAGCDQLTTIKEVECPIWTPIMQTEFVLRCIMQYTSDKSFIIWAKRWIHGTVDNDDSLAKEEFPDVVKMAKYAEKEAILGFWLERNRALYRIIENEGIDAVSIAEYVYNEYN